MPVLTATQMIPAVGQTVGVRFEELTVTCTVQDVKHVWGEARIQVTPVSGSGLKWVTLSRVVKQQDAGLEVSR